MKKHNPLFLGPNWRIVMVAFYGCSVHSMLLYAFSLFINPLQTVFEWDRTAIMTGLSLQLIAVAVFSALAGKAVDRYGARRVICLGGLIAGIGLLFLPLMKTTLHFYLCNIVVGTGSASLGPVPSSAAVTAAYEEKRGTAIGIMSTGIGVGGFVISPLIGGFFLPHMGWQISYLVVAAISLVMVPLSLVFLKKRPEQKEKHRGPVRATHVSKSPSMGKDLFSAPFILMGMGFFLFLFAISGVLQNQVPHLQDIGFPLLTVSSALAALALVSAFGKFVFGLLCDRHQPRFVFMMGAFFITAGIFLLRSIVPESPPLLIWTFALVFGVGVGSWLPTMSIMVSRTFGPAAYGTLFGVVSLLQQLGAALGPLAAGYIYDLKGSYDPAFTLYLFCAFCAVGAIAGSRHGLKKKARMTMPIQETTG